MKIYKITLGWRTDVVQELQLPEVVKSLKLGIQDRQPVLWVQVNEDSSTCTKKYKFEFTGFKLGEVCTKYVDTITSMNGLVWHLFEE